MLCWSPCFWKHANTEASGFLNCCGKDFIASQHAVAEKQRVGYPTNHVKQGICKPFHIYVYTGLNIPSSDYAYISVNYGVQVWNYIGTYETVRSYIHFYITAINLYSSHADIATYFEQVCHNMFWSLLDDTSCKSVYYISPKIQLGSLDHFSVRWLGLGSLETRDWLGVLINYAFKDFLHAHWCNYIFPADQMCKIIASHLALAGMPRVQGSEIREWFSA